MADHRELTSFEEFWDYYVGEHREKGTRMLHFLGTTAAMSCLVGAVVLRKKRLILLAPVIGYGAAWIGHFFVENNRPATFGHPLWSLRADLRMWWKIVRGEMQDEVDRVLADRERRERGSVTGNGAAVVPPEAVN